MPKRALLGWGLIGAAAFKFTLSIAFDTGFHPVQVTLAAAAIVLGVMMAIRGDRPGREVRRSSPEHNGRAGR